MNRQRVRDVLPGESGLIHPNQKGTQVGCLSVDGGNRGTRLLPDERRSPKRLQGRDAAQGKPEAFSESTPRRLTVRKAAIRSGYRMREQATARGQARDRGASLARRRQAADCPQVLTGRRRHRHGTDVQERVTTDSGATGPHPEWADLDGQRARRRGKTLRQRI